MVSSASSTSSTTSLSTSAHATISTRGVNPLLLLLSNMASMMTVKLDYNIYLVWRHQIEVILEAYSMINFIEDNLEAPDPFLKDSSGDYTTEANPEYIQWRNHEQALFTFINSTLSINLGPHSWSEIWQRSLVDSRETFCFSFLISHSQLEK
ncbi:hypothetical protein SO802_034089 [Lithocarpus litseifolius]|uniref:Retrotransposon Copia-like N-terminal domain-containing protein n=1 Tax=Lithocarpus litseifolius TaxID=425828 RepID=A0AAW2BF02_9ROSI